MEIFISNCQDLSFSVDELLADRIRSGEFRNGSGLSVASYPEEFTNDKLLFKTQIKFIAISPSGFLEVAEALFLSEFEFDNSKLLNEGVNDHAVNLLTKCTHLAQAQSYSTFILLTREKGLPVLPMELTPTANFIDELKTFLENIKANK